MVKVNIISGFLGAGKTTLIKKLIEEAYQGEKLVLIENEFGEIGIDGGFLQDAGIRINEMNSGCICCSLVGDFSEALKKVVDEYAPDRILIEPSGVGKLSDVTKAVLEANIEGAELNSSVAVVDVNKCKMYMKNFGEFFNDQIEHASCIVLSRTTGMSEKKLQDVVALLRTHNETASVITTPWEDLTGKQMLETMEKKNTLEAELALLEKEAHEHHHHHDHDEHCSCGCHDHDHHHHHADEVFTSVGEETTKKFGREEIESILESFSESDEYGMILRAKGIVECKCGKWIHFDYVPGEPDVRTGTPGVIGRICVIGAGIDKAKIKELFGI